MLATFDQFSYVIVWISMMTKLFDAIMLSMASALVFMNIHTHTCIKFNQKYLQCRYTSTVFLNPRSLYSYICITIHTKDRDKNKDTHAHTQVHTPTHTPTPTPTPTPPLLVKPVNQGYEKCGTMQLGMYLLWRIYPQLTGDIHVVYPHLHTWDLFSGKRSLFVT